MEGIFLGDFFGLFSNGSEKKETTETTQDVGNTTMTDDYIQGTEGSLHLHKEELDVSKNSSNAGEVILSKEIVEERKSIDVPVSHEEVVIERRSVDNELSNSAIGEEETIRIPVSEEHVEVSKHTVTTGEVSAYKRAVEQTQHIEETLRREEARVNTTGTVNVISSDTDVRTSYDGDVSTTNSTSSETQRPFNREASVAEVSDNNYNGDLTPS
jgi:uncharacterized protein (TIGR02271 family)